MGVNPDIEMEVRKKQLNAPRVTSDHIEESIVHEQYQRIDGSTVTVCVLTLMNGYSVVGHSACVSEQNFDEDLGKKIARQNAFDQCWGLLGFQLASQLTGYTLNFD